MPGPTVRPTLVITGEVIARQGGWEISFSRHLKFGGANPTGVVPEIQMANTEPYTNGPVPHEVRGQWGLDAPVRAVTVRCEGEDLVHITNVPTAL